MFVGIHTFIQLVNFCFQTLALGVFNFQFIHNLDQLSLQHVLDSYPHQPWSPWRCELPVNGALLLISLPSLVPEPLHQQLTTILRNHAAQASQRCLRALGSAQAHGLA